MALEGGRFVRVNRAAIQAHLDPSADGGKAMDRLADRVLARAHEKAPRSTRPSPMSQARGPMADTLEKRHFVAQDGPVWLVGSEDPRMSWVQRGTPPHVITPSKQGGSLVFPGTHQREGETVVVTRVNHPGIAVSPRSGNKGVQPFLDEALADVFATL